MHLADQRQTDRQILQPPEAVLERGNVFRHVAHVGTPLLARARGFEEEQIRKRCLRPLDAARQDGLAADEGRYEEPRIRESSGGACQLGERPIGLGDRRGQLPGQLQRRRQGARDVCPIALRRPEEPTRLFL